MASVPVAALDAVDILASGVELLRDISLQVKSGTLTVLTGPGSSGKSTILRVLWGAIPAARGAVIGDDRDLTRASVRRWSAWRRKIGIACEDFPILDTWTVAGNLAAALRVTGKFATGRMVDRINRELSQWGLLNRRHVQAGRLADSERARLALARAFVRNPAVAFLDEPVARIPANERLDTIRTIKRKSLAGTGVLVATTTGEDWAAVADEIYVLENGALRHRGRLYEPLIV